jgi:sugar lactone lactonase YvrE
MGPDGSLYAAAGNCVFRIDTSGVLTRVAGGSILPGYSGDGGVATSARLNPPSGLAVDAAGNVYIADAAANVIRRVAVASGIIAVVAGTGTLGHSGDGGPATSAQLNHPQGLAADAAGNLYIADESNYVVREVAAGTGIITTFAGNGIAGYSGDGGPAASAELSDPSAVAVDGSGNVYIADRLSTPGGAVRKVAAATGIVTTVATGSSAGEVPLSIAVDGAGNLYVEFYYVYFRSPVSYSYINEVAAATGGTTTVYPASIHNVIGSIAAASAGKLYVGSHGEIDELVVATNVITTVAGTRGSPESGDGGAATAAQLSEADSVAVDGSGNLYIADGSAERVREVAATTGIITTVAGDGTPGYWGDGGPATKARLYGPASVAVDGSGNLYISDDSNGVIRKVEAASGVITTVAGNGTYGYSGDGGPATDAQLHAPGGVAVDGSGNLYIADAWNYAIRKVAAATGIITTIASTGATNPVNLAVDGSGNVYFSGYLNGGILGVILKVAAATGAITTVAGNGTYGYSGDGGPATSAQLNGPSGVALDGAGNLYIADTGNNFIRKVAAATGIITTVAGNGTAGYSGDGGPATSAELNGPSGVAVDGAGNVYVGDSGNGLIRMLVPVATRAILSITSTHAGNFTRAESGASYSLVVSNNANAGPTNGTVTLTETLPAGLTLESMAGAGWNCSGAVCSRSDVLSPGAVYPAITVTVNVAADLPSQVTNEAVVSGGGSPSSGAADLTTIGGAPPAPVPTFPANGATGVPVAPTLTWTGAAESFDVYFGTSSTPSLTGNTTGTSYAPAILNSGTTYYWRIVARNTFGSTSSDTWSLTTGATPIGSRFVRVAPCRVADTRYPGGAFGSPSMTAGSVRSFVIPQSGCGIPATAQAYSLNVTVVPAGPLSFLTLWPTGQSRPVVSTLNSFAGTVVANAAIVPAGTDGAVSVYVSDQSDVILDINGYFDSTEAANSSSFYAATPCRVADTRGPTGQFGGPSLLGGHSRDFAVPLSPCGIPAAATAYSLNVTAVPGKDFLGFLTAWPTGFSRPLVSTLNSWAGRVVANAAIVPVGSNDSVSVFVTDPANVILDINGYFGQPGGAGALTFYPLVPCRVVDTRRAAGAFGGPEMEAQSTRSFALPASGCSVPSTAKAYSLNVTVVPDGLLSFLTAWPTGAGQPFVSTLNSFDGSIVANAAIVPAGASGAVSIYVTDRTQVILDIDGYFAP